MLLNPRNTKSVWRTVYPEMVYSITILKRGNDQQQGTVTSYKIFHARRGKMERTGEPLQEIMTDSHTTTWHIPAAELKRVGINFLSAADRIVWRDETWQPESTTVIDSKLFSNEIDVNCLRVKN